MRPTDDDHTSPADRRDLVAEILASGVTRLLTPLRPDPFSAGRSSAIPSDLPHSELAFAPEESVTVQAG